MAISDQVPTMSGFAARTDGIDVLADLDLSGRTVIETRGYQYRGVDAQACSDESAERLWAMSKALQAEA